MNRPALFAMSLLALPVCTGPAWARADPAAKQPPAPAAEYLDMTYPFDETTIYWPTAKPFKLEVVHKGPTPGGFYYEANNFCAAEHGGTHLDAPAHFAAGRWSADQVPLSDLIGPAVVVDISPRAQRDADAQLEPADLQQWEAAHGRLPAGSILLVRTGWGQNWPDKKRYLGTDKAGDTQGLHFPGIGPAAAEWLVANRRVKAVGIDTASVDRGQSRDYRTHQVLYAKNVPGLENVANLDRLPPTGATVYAIPMKIRGGSGAPCRIFATGFLPEGGGGAGGKGAQCKTDAECVMVPAGCCGCSAGGKQHAVPRAEAARLRKEQEGRCRDTACLQVMSMDPSCQATPRCEKGRCVP